MSRKQVVCEAGAGGAGFFGRFLVCAQRLILCPFVRRAGAVSGQDNAR